MFGTWAVHLVALRPKLCLSIHLFNFWIVRLQVGSSCFTILLKNLRTLLKLRTVPNFEVNTNPCSDMKKNWRNVIKLALSGALAISNSIKKALEQHPKNTFITVRLQYIINNLQKQQSNFIILYTLFRYAQPVLRANYTD